MSRVEVLRAAHPSLARATVDAARQFVFSLAEVDARPAPVRLQYTYHFVLEPRPRLRLPEWALQRRPGIGEALLVGRVREKGTRAPLAGVAVALLEAGVEGPPRRYRFPVVRRYRFHPSHPALHGGFAGGAGSRHLPR